MIPTWNHIPPSPVPFTREMKMMAGRDFHPLNDSVCTQQRRLSRVADLSLSVHIGRFDLAGAAQWHRPLFPNLNVTAQPFRERRKEGKGNTERKTPPYYIVSSSSSSSGPVRSVPPSSLVLPHRKALRSSPSVINHKMTPSGERRG